MIFHPRLCTELCIRSRLTKIVSSTRRQVYGKIYAWRMCSLHGGLGTAPQILANRRSLLLTFCGIQSIRYKGGSGAFSQGNTHAPVLVPPVDTPEKVNYRSFSVHPGPINSGTDGGLSPRGDHFRSTPSYRCAVCSMCAHPLTNTCVLGRNG